MDRTVGRMSLLGRSFERTFREIWREEEGRKEEGPQWRWRQHSWERPEKAKARRRSGCLSSIEGQTSAAAAAAVAEEEEEEREGGRPGGSGRGQMKREETLRKLPNTAE